MTEVHNASKWNEADFLTPEQRLNSVAEILATIALRAQNQAFSLEKHENYDA